MFSQHTLGSHSTSVHRDVEANWCLTKTTVAKWQLMGNACFWKSFSDLSTSKVMCVLRSTIRFKQRNFLYLQINNVILWCDGCIFCSVTMAICKKPCFTFSLKWYSPSTCNRSIYDTPWIDRIQHHPSPHLCSLYILCCLMYTVCVIRCTCIYVGNRPPWRFWQDWETWG